METLAQLEAWAQQIEAMPDATTADLDVAKRLLRHGIEAAKKLVQAQQSRDFYKRRCDALQAIQNKMRDPERKAVCDILANGETYVALGPVDRSHQYVQSKEHGGCSMCGYPEWEPWHEPRVRR